MANNTFALTVEQNYNRIIPFDLIQCKKQEIKCKKDGTAKRTKCNKIAGKDSEVYAFRTKEEISAIMKILDRHIEIATDETKRWIAHRNKLLFLVGMNIGIRASDLRTLQFKFFFDENGDFKEYYTLQPIKQRKQKKFVKLFFNKTVKESIIEYISKYPITDYNNYLFASRKGNEPITVQGLWKIIKDTAIEAGIKQNIGSHSLRKTFGYWAWRNTEDKSKALVTLQQIFNHSDALTTMKYIGLLDNEMAEMFYSVELGLDII